MNEAEGHPRPSFSFQQHRHYLPPPLDTGPRLLYVDTYRDTAHETENHTGHQASDAEPENVIGRLAPLRSGGHAGTPTAQPSRWRPALCPLPGVGQHEATRR